MTTERANARRYVAARLEKSYNTAPPTVLTAPVFPEARIFKILAEQGIRAATPLTAYASTLMNHRETLRIKAHLLRLDRNRRRRENDEQHYGRDLPESEEDAYHPDPLAHALQLLRLFHRIRHFQVQASRRKTASAFRERRLTSIHQLAAMLHAHQNVLADLKRLKAIDWDEGLIAVTPTHLVRLQRARMETVENEDLKPTCD
ncbi:hypothetical protein HYV43_07450 [Candidatus Micrarchaeota archaeon]|nr:hypothetical protein [Candidatus Micrarchaeota archaeon]